MTTRTVTVKPNKSEVEAEHAAQTRLPAPRVFTFSNAANIAPTSIVPTQTSPSTVEMGTASNGVTEVLSDHFGADMSKQPSNVNCCTIL